MAVRRGSDRARAGAAASPSSDDSENGYSNGARAHRGDGPYKLLAIDLDGTLLDHAGEAKDEDVQAIKKLKARGIKVTILTGRLFSGTRPSAELLGIDGPVGCADGSHVVNMKGHKTLLHHGIRGRAADRSVTGICPKPAILRRGGSQSRPRGSPSACLCRMAVHRSR